ncbi:hypothetical protein ACPA9J_26450 [Pseudomonas aeruginosa]
MTLESVLAALTVLRFTLVLSKAFCLRHEAATIAHASGLGLALLAATGAAAQDLTRSKAWGDPACYN